MKLSAFSQHFSLINDPRQVSKVVYPLFDIIFLTITSLLVGCKGWEDIIDFGEERLEWLRQYGDFTHGIPSHDTVADVISRIDPVQLQTAFIQWVAHGKNKKDKDHIAIDGKTLKSSYQRDDRLSAIHMVSAFSTQNQLVLGQEKTAAKSNEIKAIPVLIELLDIKNALVTIDAMGCQKEIAEAIVKKGGDYLLAVKGNQPTLYQAIQKALKPALQSQDRDSISIEKQRSRIECREHHVLDAASLEGDFSEWIGLKTVGVVVSCRFVKGQESGLEYRYYISSAELDRDEFKTAVRAHWAIENQLHWQLDVTLKEDSNSINRGDAAENMARFRHLVVNLLKSETSEKRSMARKIRRAAMSTDYLDRLLNNLSAQ